MSFSGDISKYINKTKKTADQVHRSITLRLFSGVILSTHVDTGRLRGNWQTNAGSPKREPTKRKDLTGNKPINEAKKNIVSDKDMYLTNNLPYARVREEKDAMIKKNLARIKRNIKEAVRDVN